MQIRAERFHALETSDRAEPDREHRAELVEHLRQVLASTVPGSGPFDPGDGLAAGLELAIYELEHWPPARGIE